MVVVLINDPELVIRLKYKTTIEKRHVDRKISFRIMDQVKSYIVIFKEQITYPEIKITVNINPFVIYRNIVKNHSVWHINKNITDSRMIPEKMPVVTIVIDVILYKYQRRIYKPANNMTIIRMIIVISIIPV